MSETSQISSNAAKICKPCWLENFDYQNIGIWYRVNTNLK